jgi:hypothetical protein
MGGQTCYTSMATLQKIWEHPFSKSLLIMFLIGVCFSLVLWIKPHEDRMANAEEICRAAGGAVLKAPYPRLPGIRLIPLEKGRVCANLEFRPSLRNTIPAALSAE